MKEETYCTCGARGIDLSKHECIPSLRDRIDDMRKTVIRLLEVNNPDESIGGACNNRMQEIYMLRDEQVRMKYRLEAAERLMKLMEAELKTARLPHR